MSAKLYGVGVGPGNPELLTLQAIRIMRESDVIAVPDADAKHAFSWKIASAACPELEEKELIGIALPMTKNVEVLKKSQDQGAEVLCSYLKEGKQIAFLTIGDPTVYSTYIYLHRRVQEAGFQAEMINGVPSFCAAAARLDISLAEKEEQIHIVPASYGIEEAMGFPGTKILMKAGKKLPEVIREVDRSNQKWFAIENCSMENEIVYDEDAEKVEKAGYLTVTIVKEK